MGTHNGRNLIQIVCKDTDPGQFNQQMSVDPLHLSCTYSRYLSLLYFHPPLKNQVKDLFGDL